MMAGNVIDKPYIIGIAPCTGFCFCNPSIYLLAEVRFGRQITKDLYLTGNMVIGVPLGYNDGTEHSPYSRIESHVGIQILTRPISIHSSKHAKSRPKQVDFQFSLPLPCILPASLTTHCVLVFVQIGAKTEP